MSDPLKEMFDGMSRLYTEQRELAAIWLDKAIVTGSGRTVRIAPGETLRVNGGRLVDASNTEPVTHKVLACFGTLINQFELTLVDLNTNQPLQLSI